MMNEDAEPAGVARSALETAALSDVGLRRGNNQDSFTVSLAGDESDWQRRGHLFIVADGMGAHAAGELASKIACEAVGHTYRKSAEGSPAEALRHAVQTANADIHSRGQANAEFQGMGTTTSSLVLLPRAALVAHVGDSRIYRMRGGTLEQLTFDHSLVWEMRAAGQMPGGEVANFIPKNIITRSLGPHAEVQIDMEGPFPLEVGDTFLLCSDGLSGQFKDEEIGAVLAALTPSEAVRALVDVANLRGGPDNITAIVVRVRNVPADDSAAEQTSTEQAKPPTSAWQPALWGGTAVCLLVALVLGVTEYYMAALVSVLLGAAAAVAALVQNMTFSGAPGAGQFDGPLGSGPHAAFESRPDAAAAAMAAVLYQQVKEATRAEHWTLDWGRFDAMGEEAAKAQTAGDYAAAVRNFLLAISFVMNEIRVKAGRKDYRDRSVLDL